MASTRRFLAIVGALAIFADGSLAGLSAGRAGGPPVPGQQGAPGVPLPPLTPGPAQVLGKVVEAGTSAGVANATVTLSGPLGPSTAVFSNGIPGGPRRMATDAEGRFLFRDLPAGIYTITTTAAGYVDGGYGETRVIPIRRALDLIRTLEVTDADRLVPVQIQMWKLGGIGGRVLDENGEPLVGVRLYVFARMTDWGGPFMQQAGLPITDDRGMYHIDVAPGDYVVGLPGATTTTPRSIIDGFQQAASEGDQAIRTYLTQMPMAADVFVARGMGVRVGDFAVYRGSLPPVINVGGRLMLYPSTYHPASLTPASADLVTVRSGEEKTGVDLSVRLIPARRVSGHVAGSDGPVTGLVLQLLSPDPAVMRASQAILIDAPIASSDRNGDFTFIGIAPGSYLLRTVRMAESPATVLPWAIESVAVAADTDLDGVQVALRDSVRVSGRIVIGGSGTKSPTSPQLRGITITALPVPGSYGALLGTQVRSNTEHPDDTRFVTGPAIPGASIMTVGNLPSGWILKSVTSGGQNVVDKPFDLSTSGVSDIVVTITDQISTLTGAARDESGRPVPTATIAVFPAEKSLWRLPGVASRRMQTTAPGRDGRYTFRGLPDGDYIVVAADWPAADFSDADVLTRLTPAGTRITMVDGETRTQDLRVVVMR